MDGRSDALGVANQLCRLDWPIVNTTTPTAKAVLVTAVPLRT